MHRIIRSLDLPDDGLLIDLGCSDGFIIEQLWRDGDLPGRWRFTGYDRAERLLAAASRRGIPGAEFVRIDLNDAAAQPVEPGDLVLCLETLEHLADFRSGLSVIDAAVRRSGRMVVSLPNEVGPVGVGKFLCRPLFRSRPYQEFFAAPGDAARYLGTLLAGGDITAFRSPPRAGWAAHLGFDHRVVQQFVASTYVAPGYWRLDKTVTTIWRSNFFLLATQLQRRDRS